MHSFYVLLVPSARLEVSYSLVLQRDCSCVMNSAFIGLAVMLICFPVPGLIVKRIQTMQRQVMKKTDARVQAVTESKRIVFFLPGLGTHGSLSVMNILRMVKLFS